ncbi:transporter substrate-binding domain-containing protein [Bartonella sp. LJL80]
MFTRRQFNKMVSFTAAAASVGAVGLAKTASAASNSSLDRVKASGVLRIGAVADGAPYFQKSLIDGKWRGFNIDIAQALADDLGLKLEITETTWGNSVLDLQANKIDVYFGLNPTPQRREAVDFSGPLFQNAFALITKKGIDVKTWDDINRPDFRISVDAGSSQDSAVTRLAPKANISRLKSVNDASAALQVGRVDAQCIILLISLTVLAKNKSLGTLVVPTPTDFTTSHAGFRKEEDKSWMQFVDNWINERRASGFIRDAIVRNMALVGVKESDFPAGVTL